METFGIIMASVGISIYGVYLCCCIFNVYEDCYDKIKYCCKRNTPLDMNFVTVEQEFSLSLEQNIRLPLTAHPYNEESI